MSGTSHDAIEAAAVDFTLDGDVLEAAVLAVSSTPYNAALRRRLMLAFPPAQTTLEEICALDTLIGQAFAEAAAALLADVPGGTADLVCSPGQTVYHWVEGQRALGTFQLGQPAWIAERIGLPVVADVRSRDIATGGQGAPLVSILDALLLEGSARPCAALNLGGIANVTVVRPGENPVAYDTGPANALLDAAVTELTGGSDMFDQDGARSARGTVDAELLAQLLDEQYYRLSAPKTTGKERFNSEYLRARIAGVRLDADDLLATLAALTVETVARELERYAVEAVFVAGGGTRNQTVMQGLRERLPRVGLHTFDELGVPSLAKEAVAFALIGFLTASGLSGVLPSCTGARRAAILGSITPGRGPLVLPQPAAMTPRRLRVHGTGLSPMG